MKKKRTKDERKKEEMNERQGGRIEWRKIGALAEVEK
jgi:hypothetical protein